VISSSQRPVPDNTHNTHNRQMSMFLVGFELTISVGERPQTYALDGTATGTGRENCSPVYFNLKVCWYQTGSRNILVGIIRGSVW